LFQVAKDYFNPRNIKHLETRRELERIEKEIILAKCKENTKQQPNTSNIQYYQSFVNPEVHEVFEK
jgi:hypothetical protein